MKTLYVVRHAHREVRDPSEDNGLSDKGKKQAESLCSLLAPKLKGISLQIESSPKLRCRETLEPVAEKLKLKISINPLLNEQGADSPSKQMGRIKDFIRYWSDTAPERLMICSHGDWIPQFFNEISNEAIDIKKGGFAELHLENKSGENKNGKTKIKLVELNQKP